MNRSKIVTSCWINCRYSVLKLKHKSSRINIPNYYKIWGRKTDMLGWRGEANMCGGRRGISRHNNIF